MPHLNVKLRQRRTREAYSKGARGYGPSTGRGWLRRFYKPRRTGAGTRADLGATNLTLGAKSIIT